LSARIAVVGAGAIGSLLGARLARRGHALLLVGRQEQVDAIQRSGLRLIGPDGSVEIHRIEAKPALDRDVDLVLLTVKTQDLPAAVRDIASRSPTAPVVTLQNGVQADFLAAAALGQDRVVGGVVMASASYLQPGTVSVHFPGWLVAGEPFSGPGRRLRRVVAVLRDALPTYITQHLRRTRWSKLISNLNNGLSAATGLPMSEIGRTETGRRLAVRVMKEGQRVASAAGIKLDHALYGLTPSALRQAPEAALIAVLQGLITPAIGRLPEQAGMRMLAAAGRSRLGRLPIRGSTWQSLARGRPTEIEFLNGEIVREGQARGVPVPYNSAVLEAVRRLEQRGPAWTLDGLLALALSVEAGAPVA
jgi:2-dehydropantoate 2-reductase